MPSPERHFNPEEVSHDASRVTEDPETIAVKAPDEPKKTADIMFDYYKLTTSMSDKKRMEALRRRAERGEDETVVTSHPAEPPVQSMDAPSYEEYAAQALKEGGQHWGATERKALRQEATEQHDDDAKAEREEMKIWGELQEVAGRIAELREKAKAAAPAESGTHAVGDVVILEDAFEEDDHERLLELCTKLKELNPEDIDVTPAEAAEEFIKVIGFERKAAGLGKF